MRVFVTGASGFIGSAVVRELLDAGHEVLGLARSNRAAKAVAAAGAKVHRGDIGDLDSLRRGAADSDGVVHTAFNHDFSVSRQDAATADRLAVEAMADTLVGTDRPIVIASGRISPAVTASANHAPNCFKGSASTVSSEKRGVSAMGATRATRRRCPPCLAARAVAQSPRRRPLPAAPGPRSHRGRCWRADPTAAA